MEVDKAKTKNDTGYFELDVQSMVKGIGRKATDEELIIYLNKRLDEPLLDLEEAFAKYLNSTNR